MSTILIIYGCLLLSGAYFGMRAGSKVSLYMGIISGLLIFAAVYVTTKNAYNGYLSAAIISGVLSIVFLMRVVKTHKFMPAGMLLAVSAAVCIASWVQIHS